MQLCTICGSWFISEFFLNYTFTHFSIIFYLMLTDTAKIPVPERSGSTSEELRGTRCMNPQKPTTKIKMRSAKKYKEIFRMNCLIGHRNSERIWLMKVLQQSLGETKSKEVETIPSHLMNFQWSREQKWTRVRVSTVSTRTFRRTQIVISA